MEYSSQASVPSFALTGRSWKQFLLSWVTLARDSSWRLAYTLPYLLPPLRVYRSPFAVLQRCALVRALNWELSCVWKPRKTRRPQLQLVLGLCDTQGWGSTRLHATFHKPATVVPVFVVYLGSASFLGQCWESLSRRPPSVLNQPFSLPPLTSIHTVTGACMMQTSGRGCRVRSPVDSHD